MGKEGTVLPRCWGPGLHGWKVLLPGRSLPLHPCPHLPPPGGMSRAGDPRDPRARVQRVCKGERAGLQLGAGAQPCTGAVHTRVQDVLRACVYGCKEDTIRLSEEGRCCVCSVCVHKLYSVLVRCCGLCVRVQGALSTACPWGLLYRQCQRACAGDAACSACACKVLRVEDGARCGVCARAVCVQGAGCAHAWCVGKARCVWGRCHVEGAPAAARVCTACGCRAPRERVPSPPCPPLAWAPSSPHGPVRMVSCPC